MDDWFENKTYIEILNYIQTKEIKIQPSLYKYANCLAAESILQKNLAFEIYNLDDIFILNNLKFIENYLLCLDTWILSDLAIQKCNFEFFKSIINYNVNFLINNPKLYLKKIIWIEYMLNNISNYLPILEILILNDQNVEEFIRKSTIIYFIKEKNIKVLKKILNMSIKISNSLKISLIELNNLEISKKILESGFIPEIEKDISPEIFNLIVATPKKNIYLKDNEFYKLCEMNHVVFYEENECDCGFKLLNEIFVNK